MAFIRKEEGFVGSVWPSWVSYGCFRRCFLSPTNCFRSGGTLLTLFESLLFYSWLLVGLTLVIERWISSDLFILCSILIGMTAFVLALVAGRNTNDLPMPEGLVSRTFGHSRHVGHSQLCGLYVCVSFCHDVLVPGNTLEAKTVASSAPITELDKPSR